MAVGPSSERLFPTLTEAQIHRIAAHGRRRQTTKGEVLVEIGDTAPFFVVVRGAIQVLSPTAGRRRSSSCTAPDNSPAKRT
jgi:CRP-like cAMP-binding protein